jgi:tetratricopeptide (TPR) repeat protein
MTLRWLLLAALAAAPARAQTPPSAKDQAAIKAHYEKAFEVFKMGGYSQAIQEWNEVLKLDPEQKTASAMLRMAREKIDERDRLRQNALFEFIREGQYQKALVALQPLLESDPTHPLYQVLQARLERLVEIVRFVPNRDKAWTMARTAMTGFIANKEDLQLAYNGMIYAMELAPGEARFASMLALITAAAPDLGRRRNTTGTGFLDYMNTIALRHIYDGRYHQAIDVLNQVLALESNEVTSLKRLGSAHYALRQYREAQTAWLHALQVDPGDAALRHFLARLDLRKGGAHAKAAAPSDEGGVPPPEENAPPPEPKAAQNEIE